MARTLRRATKKRRGRFSILDETNYTLAEYSVSKPIESGQGNDKKRKKKSVKEATATIDRIFFLLRIIFRSLFVPSSWKWKWCENNLITHVNKAALAPVLAPMFGPSGRRVTIRKTKHVITLTLKIMFGELVEMASCARPLNLKHKNHLISAARVTWLLHISRKT